MVFAQHLEKGDPIVVSYGNHLVAGIFVGYGSVGNVNFYRPQALAYCKDLGKGRLPYKSYINRTDQVSIARIHLMDVDSGLQDTYLKALDYLKEKGVL